MYSQGLPKDEPMKTVVLFCFFNLGFAYLFLLIHRGPVAGRPWPNPNNGNNVSVQCGQNEHWCTNSTLLSTDMQTSTVIAKVAFY